MKPFVIKCALVIAAATIVASCKRPVEGTSALQTLDNMSERGGQWHANQCGDPSLNQPESWTTKTGGVADRLLALENVIASTGCIVGGDAALQSTAKYMLKSASPAVVAWFCKAGGKITISSDLAASSCQATELDDLFANEGRQDFQTCLTINQGTPTLVVQEDVNAIRHTLIRGVSYLYSGMVVEAAKTNDPIAQLDLAYLNVLKDAYLEDLKGINSAVYAKYKDFDSEALTRFVFSEAIDQAQCNRTTADNFKYYPKTKSVFFDTAAARAALAGVTIPANFIAFGLRHAADNQLVNLWYTILK